MERVRVVVTGMGVISPLGLSVEATWQALLAGKSGVARITAFDPTPFDTQIAAEVKGFAPENYMDRKEARRTDRFAQFAIAAAQEALRQAGLDGRLAHPERCATIIGTGVGGILTLSQQFAVLHEKGPQRVSPFLVPMMLTDMAAGQVSIAFGLKGPNFGIVSACASGSDAIGQAYELIRRGEVDLALAGGAEAPICPIAIAGFNACQALSRRNHEPERASRPFDAQRDGFVIGEGAAILVLERLEHALARGARPLGELVGYAATADAYHITQPSPGGEGGARAMALALRRAGLQPQDVDYINAHGTSTPLNDKYETQAIKTVFGEEAYRIPISSTKSMTGHLLGAAGALEAVITVMSILRGAIPPTINLDTPDPECDLDYTPWTPRRGRVRVAMSNAFGFGGHNSTLIFRQWEP
ncbi:MAG: beta-ketoacyl-ACP synthase II [Dehalococcoidia bacterium]|nr:beta-ketoacyl-ACP synthase II [Dehalococcoidia bacterium]MDW8119247.1 beta-ketoacyl-ACP synthase II [Chloroflexota bacterium]